MMTSHQNSRAGKRKWRGGAWTNLRLAVSILALRSLSWLCQSSCRLGEKALIKTFVQSQSHWEGLIKPLFQTLPEQRECTTCHVEGEWRVSGIEVGWVEGGIKHNLKSYFIKTCWTLQGEDRCDVHLIFLNCFLFFCTVFGLSFINR